MPSVIPRLDRSFRAAAGVWLGMAGVLVLGGLAGLFYFLATAGPKKIPEADVAMGRETMSAAQRRMSDDIGEGEAEFHRRAAAERGTPAMMAILERAIGRQKQLLAANPRAGLEQNVRLERLLAARDTARAEEAGRRIEELQRTTETEQKAGRPAVALEIMRQALQLQQAINNSGADAHAKNIGRERELVRAIETAEAEPLARTFATAMQQARAAMAEQRWSEALAAFGRAREAQLRLNRDYPRTRFTNRPVLDEIDAEIASLNAAGLAAEIDDRSKSADAAAARGRPEESAGLYKAAIDLQLSLNQSYARSRFASTARIEELETRRQTVLAAERLAAAAALDQQAAVALVKRQVLAAERKIRDALTLLAAVEKEFPRSRNFDGERKIRLAYLEAQRAGLRALQDRVYERLVPLPDVKDRWMLRTEAPQDLYAKIMSLNPSRNPDPARPVDSVNWHDAQEFCRRLTWLLGARVRLPTEREFRLAVGDGEVEGWSSETAAGRSQAVAQQAANENGFCDLAGNLAEWLDPEADDGPKALVAGGSYLEPSAELRKIPLVPADKNERARHVGFRIVVELALD